MRSTNLIGLLALAIVAFAPGARGNPPTTRPAECPFRFHFKIIPPTTRPFGPQVNPPNLMPFAPAPGQILPGREPIPRDWIRREFNGEPFYLIPCSG